MPIRSPKRQAAEFRRLRPLAVDALFSGAAFTEDHARLESFIDADGPPPDSKACKAAEEYIGKFLTFAGLDNIASVSVSPIAPFRLRIIITRIENAKPKTDERIYVFKRRRLIALPEMS